MRDHRRINFVIATTFALLLTANIAAAQSGKLQLYFFTNPQCGPCKLVEPELEQLYRDGYSVMKIDTSIHPDWTRRFQVTKTPTVVLVAGNTVVASHSGFIDANTLRSWFDSAKPKKSEQATAVSQARDRAQAPVRERAELASESSTVRVGTFHPENSIEEMAMRATVRLKVDDADGTSYATGTVVHALENEALVLTCGHAFRDSGGRGSISAEYGFLDPATKSAVGELIFYDADERDIALVAIRTDGSIKPVPVAGANLAVDKSQAIFSIGCDNGRNPSIRRSKIIGKAKYDGVNKLEIVGRPVNGRSGGGLFTTDGKLVGVCNAAVVDSDEGVYVTLDTIHWQFDQVNLAYLFKSQNPIPQNLVANQNSLASSDLQVRPRRNFDAVPVRNPLNQSATQNRANQLVTTPASLNRGNSETELIMVMRRKGEAATESWTLANPDPNLISQLKSMPRTETTRGDRLAQLRLDMPNLPKATGKDYNLSQMRAQSPK